MDSDLVVDHIDENKHNNHIKNLQLITISENIRKNRLHKIVRFYRRKIIQAIDKEIANGKIRKEPFDFSDIM